MSSDGAEDADVAPNEEGTSSPPNLHRRERRIRRKLRFRQQRGRGRQPRRPIRIYSQDLWGTTLPFRPRPRDRKRSTRHDRSEYQASHENAHGEETKRVHRRAQESDRQRRRRIEYGDQAQGGQAFLYAPSLDHGPIDGQTHEIVSESDLLQPVGQHEHAVRYE